MFSKINFVLVSSVIIFCAAECEIDPLPSGPFQLVVTEGNNQEGIMGEVLPGQLVIRLTDENGAVVENSELSFQVTQGGGTIIVPNSITNSEGEVEVEWELGFEDTKQIVEVSIVNDTNMIVPLKLTGTATKFKDGRDGTLYTVTKINDQIWMAENLNYNNNNTVGVCYENNQTNCNLYGRMYTWYEVMDGASATDDIPSGVRGICPSGWHLPSADELYKIFEDHFTRLDNGIAIVPRLMGNCELWINCSNCINDTRFSLLPGGVKEYNNYRTLGTDSYLWTSSEYDQPSIEEIPRWILTQGALANSCGVSINSSYPDSSTPGFNPKKDVSAYCRCVKD